MSILSLLHCSSQKIITTEVCDPNCTIIRPGAVFATVVLTDYCIKTEYDQILITGPQRPESEKGIVIVKAIYRFLKENDSLNQPIFIFMQMKQIPFLVESNV